LIILDVAIVCGGRLKSIGVDYSQAAVARRPQEARETNERNTQRRNTQRRETKMTLSIAKRVSRTCEYLFAELDRKKKEAMSRGVDVVDLGVGDPAQPTPGHIIEALKTAADCPENHRYPSYAGKASLRQAVADYMGRRFGVSVDSDSEVVVLIGSKEGIAHMAWAMLDPGDVVLVPDPAYPVYSATARFCDAEPYRMELRRSNGFLPDLGAIPEEVAKKAKLMWLNYPNNPTSATASMEFFENAVAFARKHGIAVANDASYAEIYLDEKAPPSILQVEGGRDVAVEFHSLSKTFNMTGWRVGWATGSSRLIDALGRVKTNVDSGAFGAVQDAAETALRGKWTCVEETRKRYAWRRDTLCAALKKAGWDVIEPTATFFVLAVAPEHRSDMDTAAWLLDKGGIVCTPVVGMGEGGKGLLRFSLTADDERVAEAAKRIEELGQP
jgi:LL-diaminopimelate aminotransferase